MSQYPQYPQGPQQQPNWPGHLGYGAGFFDPLAKAKRAGTLMIVLGVLGLLCGGMAGWTGANWDQVLQMYPPEMRSAMSEVKASSMIVAGEVMAGVSLVMLLLGFFVRRGSKGAMIAGVVLSGLLLLYFGFSVLGVFALMGKG